MSLVEKVDAACVCLFHETHKERERAREKAEQRLALENHLIDKMTFLHTTKQRKRERWRKKSVVLQ